MNAIATESPKPRQQQQAVRQNHASGSRASREQNNVQRESQLGWETRPTSGSNIFRWYRSGWGKYTQADPVGLQADPNLFAYARGNPIRVYDSTGLFAQIVCRQVSAAAGGTWWQKKILDVYQPLHCRLRVKCGGCKGNPGAFDKTVGRENINPKGSPGIYDTTIDDYSTAKYGKSPWDSTPVDSFGPPCQFERCVLKAFEAQDKNPGLVPPYNAYPGPNSNTYVNELIKQCGGQTTFPDKAAGYDYFD